MSDPKKSWKIPRADEVSSGGNVDEGAGQGAIQWVRKLGMRAGLGLKRAIVKPADISTVTPPRDRTGDADPHRGADQGAQDAGVPYAAPSQGTPEATPPSQESGIHTAIWDGGPITSGNQRKPRRVEISPQAFSDRTGQPPAGDPKTKSVPKRELILGTGFGRCAACGREFHGRHDIVRGNFGVHICGELPALDEWRNDQ